MENYILKSDETVLYRGSVVVMPDGKSEAKNVKKGDLLLTNFNIVIITQTKKLLKTVTDVEVYRTSDVKTYDESVQVIRRKSVVDVYLKTGELFLDFKKEKEAKLFCDKALRLISGESKFVRSVKKVKKEIKETDEALDINIEEAVVNSAKMAAAITVGVATVPGVGKKTKILGKIAETLLGENRKNNPKELPEAQSETNEGNEE